VDCGGSCAGPCGGTCSGTVIINATTPEVTSGTFTDGSELDANYDNNRRCNFVIVAPPNQLVVVSFTRLVGRCKLTPGWEQLTPRLLSVLETKT